jgi:hypothetical protein
MTQTRRCRWSGILLVGVIGLVVAAVHWQPIRGQPPLEAKGSSLEKDWKTLKTIYGDGVVSVFAKLSENPVETGRLTGLVELFGTRYLQLTSKRVGTPTLIRVDIIQGIKQWNEP